LLLVFFVLFGVLVFRLFGGVPNGFFCIWGARRWGAFDVTCAVFLLEPLYSAGRIDVFLLACIEWMAHRAYLCVDFFYRAAGLEGVAAAAMNHHLIVFWMYLFFHNYDSQIYRIMYSNIIDRYFNRNFYKIAFSLKSPCEESFGCAQDKLYDTAIPTFYFNIPCSIFLTVIPSEAPILAFASPQDGQKCPRDEQQERGGSKVFKLSKLFFVT